MTDDPTDNPFQWFHDSRLSDRKEKYSLTFRKEPHERISFRERAWQRAHQICPEAALATL